MLSSNCHVIQREKSSVFVDGFYNVIILYEVKATALSTCLN